MCVGHLVTYQSSPIDTLTIMDTGYDKQIFVFYRRNISCHVNFWSEPETGNNEIYVCACVSCVWLIKRYDILSMPLHLFQDDAHCRIDNYHVETLTIWEKV